MARLADIMARLDLIEESDRWILPIDGQVVSMCCVDYALTLRLANEVSIRISEKFSYTGADGKESNLDPEGDPAQLGPALAVCRATVASAFAAKNGVLTIRFVDAGEIVVPASSEYEPWEMSGPAGLRVISTPGGDLSVWFSA